MLLYRRKTVVRRCVPAVIAVYVGLCWLWISTLFASQETADTSCSWVCQPPRICDWVRRCYTKRMCTPRQSCHLVKYYLLDDEGRKVLFRKNKCEVIQNCGYRDQCGMYNTCSLLPNCRAVCPQQLPTGPKIVDPNMVTKVPIVPKLRREPTLPEPIKRTVPSTLIKPRVVVVRTVLSGVGKVSTLVKQPAPSRVQPQGRKEPQTTAQNTCTLQLLERLLWFNLNRYRQQQKLREFSCVGELSTLARQWSERVCRSKTWTLRELQTKVRAIPVDFVQMDAFVAQGYSWRQVLTQWQKNPKSSALQQGNWSRIGVGVVPCQQQFVWSVILLP